MKYVSVKHSVFLVFQFQDEEGDSPQLSKDHIDKLKSEAQNLLEQEATSYNTSK
jgi:hypothetical protein